MFTGLREVHSNIVLKKILLSNIGYHDIIYA